jgi:hypothetical protein
MRKTALLALTTLLITSHAFAGTLNPASLAHTILNGHQYTGSNKGTFSIVYGGKDISRGNVNIKPTMMA